MQDLKDNNLVDDTGTAAPEIIEIPLRDLCTNIDLDALRKQNEPADADDDWPSSWQDDWLLPDREEMTPLNAANNSSHEEICETNNCSPLLETSQNGTLDSPNRNSLEDDPDDGENEETTNSAGEKDLTPINLEECKLVDIDINEPTTTQMAVVPFRRRSNPRVRFADNGRLSCGDLTSLPGEMPNNVNDDRYSKCKSSWCEDRNNILASVDSKDTSVLPMKNNQFKSLIWKRPSLQDQLLPSMQTGFCVESITKEELLVMWKTSEIELTRRLEKALKEKARLEQKLADLELGSPV